ncbi:putative E3 ubiquitin-protein ligase SINA-like 6 isoform X1 [Nymphaea colorata]|nr:putative E3 ubiquitin-protein ligase SINA-like 6 isoform X1 [Nymphaea colorata]
MAKFSVGDEEEAGPSTNDGVDDIPDRKRRRTGETSADGEECGDVKDAGGGDADKIAERGEGRGANRLISVAIDPDLLDCPICMEPLAPPIYQCWNGHITCSSCCLKLKKKCHTCFEVIGLHRCLAMEKVVESIKINCCYARFGCLKSISYADKTKHEDSCIYAPYVCPIWNCTFCGTSEQICFHFMSVHSVSTRCFRYNHSFTFTMDKTEECLVLHGDDGLLFLVNNRIDLLGNAVAVALISPSCPRRDFAYDLIVRCRERSLRLQSFTRRVKQAPDLPSQDFLLIPHDAYLCDGQLKLEICIYSIPKEPSE